MGVLNMQSLAVGPDAATVNPTPAQTITCCETTVRCSCDEIPMHLVACGLPSQQPISVAQMTGGSSPLMDQAGGVPHLKIFCRNIHSFVGAQSSQAIRPCKSAGQAEITFLMPEMCLAFQELSEIAAALHQSAWPQT